MKRQIGLWVSRKEAVVVILADGAEEMLELSSGIDKRAKAPIGARDAFAEDLRERRFEHQFARYYDEIIGHLRGADALLIFGPGDSKIELKKRLADEGLQAEVVSVKDVDRLTRRQVAAFVREHFKDQGK